MYRPLREQAHSHGAMVAAMAADGAKNIEFQP